MVIYYIYIYIYIYTYVSFGLDTLHIVLHLQWFLMEENFITSHSMGKLKYAVIVWIAN